MYTYLIGWSKLNKFYYGVRYAKKATPSELWVTYFTSSKHVASFRATHGEPDIIQIRREFSDESKARDWECKVLTRLGIPKNEKFLNRTNNKSIFYERDETWRKNRSGVNHPRYGKPSPFKGKSHTDDAKKKNSLAHLGRKTGRTSETFTDEWKANISKNHARLSRQQPIEEREKRKELAVTTGFSKCAEGRIWVNDGKKSYRILPDDLPKYPSYKLGRLKINPENICQS